MGKSCLPHEKGSPEDQCPACILAAEKEEMRKLLKEAEMRLGGYIGERFKEVEELREKMRRYIGRR